MSTNQYYVKILLTCNNDAPAYQRIIKTFAKDEEQAEANVDSIVSNWGDVEFYWIRKITIEPFNLRPFILEILLKYPQKTKSIKMKLHLEDPGEASQVFATLSEDWNYLVDFQIIKLLPV